MNSGERKNLLLGFKNRRAEWAKFLSEHAYKKSCYKFWISEFSLRVNDLKNAIRRKDNLYWIEALKARIRDMHFGMVNLHYHRRQMLVIYGLLKKDIIKIKEAGYYRYLRGEVLLPGFNAKSCELIF